MTETVRQSEPIGHCIYCSRELKDLELTDEHIIPYSLGGGIVLPKSSCRECAAITSQFERHCAQVMFGSLRVHHNAPTRRPKLRPKTIRVLDGKEPQVSTAREVSVEEAPGLFFMPHFSPPGVIGDAPPTPYSAIEGVYYGATTPDAVERQKRLVEGGYSGALAYGEFKPYEFARLLAKIAHSCGVAAVGWGNFEPWLPPLILGQEPNTSHLVGGFPTGDGPSPLREPADTSLHQLETDTAERGGVPFIFAKIRLFTHYRPPPPTYLVVIGRFPL